MKHKITALIVASVVGLLALSLIEGYLISNTYQLKKEAFIASIMEPVSKIDDHFPGMDSVSTIWQKELLQLMTAYTMDEVAKDSILPKLRKEIASLDEKFTGLYREELIENNIEYALRFQKAINELVITDSIQNDTIFSGKQHTNFRFLGESFEPNRDFKLGRSTWHSNQTLDYMKDGERIMKPLNFKFVTDQYVNIDDWERNVFSQMKALLFTSVFIFLFVFGLLFYSIKNLITQKKIADLKTDFINNMTHEFKTPLATLTLATKMLKSETVNSPQTHNTVNIIERQNKRLQKLTDQVLSNARGYQEIELNLESVNPVDYLSMVLADFKLSAGDENMQLTHDFSFNNEMLDTDPFYMTTALFNVLDNARKYNGDEVKIHCRAEVESSFQISIQDNGIGISGKNQKSLFDKFYRIDNTEVHDVKGLGLGLYYADQIVKAHGGEILVESKEGGGSTFTIELPFTNK